MGNLTVIYDVQYFGKISISSVGNMNWMLWLTILKIKISATSSESLAFVPN
jgi:hypothetical protein